VHDVLTKDKGNYVTALADLTAALTQQSSVAGAIGMKVAKETNWNFLGIYLTPTASGDASIAASIEAYTGEKFGFGGTLTTVRLIAEAIQAVEQISNSGLTLSVMEDKLLAQRWSECTYNIDSLFAYSAVGSTGLDTVPLPGDISLGKLKRIFSDVAVFATKWNTPLSARLLPVSGKQPGDKTEFQLPDIFNTTVHPSL
jgi:hypothetical protein